MQIETITKFISDDCDVTIGLNGHFMIDDGNDIVALTRDEAKSLRDFLNQVFEDQ